MPGSAADSALYGPLFGEREMESVFSDAALIHAWLRVEAGLARAEARAGVIPVAAAERIAAAAASVEPDAQRLGDGVAHVGYPIVPLIALLEEACGAEHGRWVHWGATTQDIMDTACVLQLVEARALLQRRIGELGDVLAGVVDAHRDTPLAARTHGQQAVPTTFGYKAAVWLAELTRHRRRLDAGADDLLVAELGGAAGTLASLGPAGHEVRRLFAEELGLRDPAIPWHTARDSLAQFALTVALVAATLGKIAREVVTLSRTEIGEIAEGHSDGRGASSTMPQKRNPILAETIGALSRLVALDAPAALAWMQQDNERGVGEWHLEWDVLPRICIHASAALVHARRLFEDLSIDSRQMLRNLDLTGGAINAEAVMMRLAQDVGRPRAHDIVYAAASAARSNGVPLIAALRDDPHVTEVLDRAELEALLHPPNYLGLAPDFCARVLDEWTHSERLAASVTGAPWG